MIWPQIFWERAAFSFEKLDLLLRLSVIAFRSNVRKRQTLIVRTLTTRRVGSVLRAVEVLVEIEQVEQVVLSFLLSVLLIQFDQILGGAVTLFLNEADVVLLLELEHFIFAVTQIFFDLNELFGNSRRNFVATVLAHSTFEIEILLHSRIQIGLGVLGCAANRGQIKNGRARLLQDGDFNRYRL